VQQVPRGHSEARGRCHEGRLVGSPRALESSAFSFEVGPSGGIISGTGLTVGLIVGGIPAIMVSWFLLGIGLSVVIPLMFSAAGTLASKKYAGVIAPSEAVAKVSGVSYFGFVIGPPLIGFIADIVELRWTLLLIAAFAYLLIFASRYAREA